MRHATRAGRPCNTTKCNVQHATYAMQRHNRHASPALLQPLRPSEVDDRQLGDRTSNRPILGRALRLNVRVHVARCNHARWLTDVALLHRCIVVGPSCRPILGRAETSTHPHRNFGAGPCARPRHRRAIDALRQVHMTRPSRGADAPPTGLAHFVTLI